MKPTSTLAMTDPVPIRRKRALRITVTALVTVIVLLLIAVLWPRKPSAASLALDAKLAQLRADGVPLTAIEIAKVLPDPDPQHDAHTILRDAFATPAGSLSGNVPFAGGGTLPQRTEAFSEPVMQSMELYLSHSDNLLQKIPDQLDGVWFSRGWTNGFTNLTRISFIDFRQLIQTLAVKALYEAERGNAARSAEALRKGFAVSAILNGDELVNAMIRVAAAGAMCEAAERTLNRVRLAEIDLLEIQRRINIDLIDNFDYTFMAERHMGMLVFDAAREGRDYLEDRPLKLLLWKLDQLFSFRQRKKFYRDEDYLIFLNLTDERQLIHRLPGCERIRRYEQLDAHYITNVQSLTAEAVWPNWNKAMRTATEAKARLTALKAALAIERYRLAHTNALPDALDALAPDYLPSAPRDPMDEQPLRFKKLPRGYVIYSIGADGIDNGGAERGAVTNNYDITITIER